ncbi:MAG TPA: dihydroorotate dehydrogenase electron transfer subunit [Burkholderiales bacterium]|nr:dihydroorotate dehydrogenase electron transfer subunit [Burkholderiales bacterium]
MPIDRKTRILEAKNWGDYHLLTIESPAAGRGARPGQFVMVKVADTAFPLLRRPFSLHDAGPSGVKLFFRTAGVGTEILARKKPGDAVDILGPLGKGFSAGPELQGKRAVLVGGGRGIAPLFFLARELAAARAKPMVLYGGRTVADIPLRDEFEKAGFPVLCSTDDGSFGFKGLVTGLLGRELDRSPADRLFVCGPDAMMKVVAGMAGERRIPAEFSLESIMGCGIGACWGCVHRIRDGTGQGWVKICEEGPVFAGDRIVWED